MNINTRIPTGIRFFAVVVNGGRLVRGRKQLRQISYVRARVCCIGKIYDENDKNLMIPLGDYVLKVIWARNGTSTE